MEAREKFRVIDLFCGAGGLSLGFSRAGFDIVFAADHHHQAVKTYRANLGNHVQEIDLSRAGTGFSFQADVIVGGPPCQGFSSAGLRKAGDQRNHLVSLFAEIVATQRPKAFVFENVEGFLTAGDGKQVFDLLTPLVAAGYRIHLRKINTANFGVAQHRKRVIAIGGLGWNPAFPQPTHFAFGSPGAQLAGVGLIPAPTVAQALNGLSNPSIRSPGAPQGHFYRPLNGVDLERSVVLDQGQTMRDLPVELQHMSYRRRANRRVMDGTPTERRGGAPSGVRRLRADEPSKAITGGALTEFLHPLEHRPLTIRECARLQSFPDTFVFYGSQSQQIQMIGNAVPPLFAEILAASLLRDLADSKVVDDDGKLLSFVPTLSTGFSPILKKVTDSVIQTFSPSGLETQSSFAWF